ncbi:hypothetical protein ACQPZX_22190 [Actinoplanes sp. CA-142083]
MRPLLFLDVDGPLIPFRSRALSPPDPGNPSSSAWIRRTARASTAMPV